MPEALEKWSLPLFQNLLPRHLQIIFQLNQVFLDSVRYQFANSDDLIPSLSIIEESNPKQVRMANLAVIGSHTVNGVASIHSELMKKYVFKSFSDLFPEKFQNKTNGVTIRRWLHHCNPGLSALITEATGSEDWAQKAEELKGILSKLDDSEYFLKWLSVKQSNKQSLATYIHEQLGIQLNPESQLFDIQVKRIHEYKRQTLNIFGVIYRYLTILESSQEERNKMTPRAVIIGGKAAPGYYAAKKLIKLINNVSNVINSDSTVGDLLKLVFIPNYNVSIAEIIIPAADINEQISTAGTEASGTSNMKFAFNSSLIIGTYDGANIEIGEAIGNENVFFFGAKADEVDHIKATANERPINPKLQHVFQSIRSGLFGDPQEYECLLYPIEHGDGYLVNYDFDSYINCQLSIDESYKDQDHWVKMCMKSTANMARFSSDRTIKEYAEQIWKIEPHALPPAFPQVEIAQQPTSMQGYGSIGSIRRQHQAIVPQQSNEPYVFKGSFGSLSYKNQQIPNPVPPTPKVSKVQPDSSLSDEEEKNIDI